VPGLALRWYYTESRLAGGVDIDVESRGEPLRMNLDPGNTFLEVRMRAYNLLPMVVELDRCAIVVDCDGAFRFDMTSVERKVLRPGAWATVKFRSAVPDGYVVRLVQHSPTNGCGISGQFEFDCKVRRFPKNVGDLRGAHVTRLNAHLR